MTLEAALTTLKEAFPSSPIDPADTFVDFGAPLDAERFRQGVRGRLWTELDAAFLEFHHDAVFFLGPSSFPVYLPAYLSSVLRRDQELSSMPSFLFGALSRNRAPGRFDARVSRLTRAQKLATAQALAAYESAVAGTRRVEDVKVALDEYWRALLREQM